MPENRANGMGSQEPCGRHTAVTGLRKGIARKGQLDSVSSWAQGIESHSVWQVTLC